jgi:protein gp37
MGTATGIEWCDHTFNPWIGCTAVSPACDRCYAQALVERWGGDFATRRRTAPANWRQPLIWNRKAAADGVRRRVFCASLADVFDNQVPDEWRRDLWTLIDATPALDWLLLTKRPQNIAKMLPHRINEEGFAWPLRNVWLGTTAENQAEADRRIPHLLAAPAAVRFLSCEPLLGPLDLTRWSGLQDDSALPVDWVIAGGESGPGARPMNPTWAYSLRDQCAAAVVPFFFKQWGEFEPVIITLDGCGMDTGSGQRLRGPAVDDWADYVFAEARDHRGDPKLIDRRFWASGDGQLLHRCGKKAAGALLDERQHKAFPA